MEESINNYTCEKCTYKELHAGHGEDIIFCNRHKDYPKNFFKNTKDIGCKQYKEEHKLINCEQCDNEKFCEMWKVWKKNEHSYFRKNITDFSCRHFVKKQMR